MHTPTCRIGWRLNWTEQSGAVCHPPRIYVGELPGRKIPSASPAQTHPSSAELLRQFAKRRASHTGFPHTHPNTNSRMCLCTWVLSSVKDHEVKLSLQRNFYTTIMRIDLQIKDPRARQEKEMLCLSLRLYEIFCNDNFIKESEWQQVTFNCFSISYPGHRLYFSGVYWSKICFVQRLLLWLEFPLGVKRNLFRVIIYLVPSSYFHKFCKIVYTALTS